MELPDPQYIPVDLNPAETEARERAALATPPADEGDPFLDDRFAPLDTRPEPGHFRTALEQIASEEPPIAAPPAPSEAAAPAPAAAAPETPATPAADEPIVRQFDDGSSMTIEHTNKGWQATLDSGIPGTNLEVFYGRTKDELLANVARGKVHATRQIRKLNREIKLNAVRETPTQTPTPVAVPQQPQARTLSADELMDFRTQFTTDPNAAMEKWLKIRTGLSPEELAQSVRSGETANLELYEEGVAKVFIAEHPEYISNAENFSIILAWMFKEYLGQRMPRNMDSDTAVHTLARAGAWKSENLDEAFTDLAEAGLLELERENPQVTAPPVTPARAAAPAPAAQPPIVTPQRTVRPRLGSLGISQRESSATPPAAAPQPVSADDLEDLSDAQIAQLFTGVRRERIRDLQPRRR